MKEGGRKGRRERSEGQNEEGREEMDDRIQGG